MGECWTRLAEEGGGEAGRAVSAALRSTELRGGEPAKGDEVARRMASGGVDVEEEDAERECGLGMPPGLLLVRAMGEPDTILDLGDVGGETL